MSNFVNCISNAEKWTTKNEKHSFLSQLDSVAQRLVHEALSPFRQFSVKKWEHPVCTNKVSPDQEDYTRFFELLDKLSSRELTGNEARKTVQQVLSTYSELSCEYLTRVILKDLKCGANSTTFNDLFPGLIPEFETAAAKKMDEDVQPTYPSIGQFKKDGQRVVAFVRNGKVDYLSRSGKPASFCAGLFDEDLIRIEKEYFKEPFVLDGEVMGKTFQETMESKGSGASKTALFFHAFDIMTLSEWDAKQTKLNNLQRIKLVQSLVNALGLKRIIEVPWVIINSSEELKNYFKTALSAGDEGLIMKDPNSHYSWSRSSNWIKVKPIIDLDLECVGIYPGKKGSRLANSLGGIKLAGYDENGRYIETNCGSGFGDEDRELYFKNPNLIIGKTIMIEAQELSKAKNATCWSARFAVFVRIRDDK